MPTRVLVLVSGLAALLFACGTTDPTSPAADSAASTPNGDGAAAVPPLDTSTPLDSAVAETVQAGSDTASPTDTPSDTPSANPACTGGPARGVTFDTADGVTLAADYHPVASASAPAVILLHMNPQGNTRANFSASVREAFNARGFHVLNVDRRGAGGSGGVATDAFIGAKGKLDAEAAVGYLQGLSCPPGMEKLAIIGASNGTTTALDYTVAAAADPGLPLPAALVFMSGGSYTEAQNSMAASKDILASLPMLFAFPAGEARWNDEQANEAPAGWRFIKYTPGSHGTRLFTSAPESLDDIGSFLSDALK